MVNFRTRLQHEYLRPEKMAAKVIRNGREAIVPSLSKREDTLLRDKHILHAKVAQRKDSVKAIRQLFWRMTTTSRAGRKNKNKSYLQEEGRKKRKTLDKKGKPKLAGGWLERPGRPEIGRKKEGGSPKTLFHQGNIFPDTYCSKTPRTAV